MGIAGAILAGGRSTRMGRDKARIPIEGVPMALRTAATLRLGGCERVHIVGREPSLRNLGLPLIMDELEIRHPLSGVSAALSQIPEEWVLIAPCDLIHLTPADVQALVSFGAPCVACSRAQRHPLLAILPSAWARRANDLALAGAPSMALTEELPAIELPPVSLTDANTPADLPR